MGNRTLLFGILFDASHETLTTLSADDKWLGAQCGITSILHTNGQDLSFHPHVHCIVSGGGIDEHGKWIAEKRKNGKFIFPRPLLEQTFRDLFLKKLQQLHRKQLLQLVDETAFVNMVTVLQNMQWNVYAKAPFGGPEQIVDYLGNYTHKVAITAQRITEITKDSITFNYKDYRDNDKVKPMTLSHTEFIRRFEQHILPKRFVKIRHAGFLTNRNKMSRIQSILTQLNLPNAMPKVKVPTTVLLLITTGKDVTICPKCGTGKMVRIATILNIKGQLVNIDELNRGSPTKLPKNSICKNL
ncbi:unnamed protein product [Rotaria magnacalcarata]|nr:unnamed protein product [Rotaria magnacalcarata]